MKKIVLLFAMLMVFPVLVNAELLSYETGMHEEYDMDEWTLLYIANGDLWEADGELSEPVTIQKFNISSDKAVKSIEIKEKRSPKEFTINLPQVEYSGDYYSYEPRDCFYDKREAYMVISSYDYADIASVSLEVHPLEINDCKKGIFTLYQEMDFEIEYYEENKIKSVEYDNLTPGEETILNFELENINPESEIIVYDDWGSELASKEVYSDTEKLTVTVPEDTSDLYLNVEYREEGEIVDRAVITQDLNWGEMDFRVLVSDDELEFPLAVQIDNAKKEEISVKLKIVSIDSESEEMSKVEKTVKAPAGSSIHYISLPITEEEKINDIYIEATHYGITKYAEHNSLVRFTPEEVKGGLPKSPGQEIAENLLEAMKGEGVEEEASTSRNEPTAKTTIIAVIAAVALFIIAGYIALKYAKKE